MQNLVFRERRKGLKVPTEVLKPKLSHPGDNGRMESGGGGGGIRGEREGLKD